MDYGVRIRWRKKLGQLKMKRGGDERVKCNREQEVMKPEGCVERSMENEREAQLIHPCLPELTYPQ